MLMAVYTGMVDNMVLIRVSRPLWCNNFSFHAGSLLAILSARRCSEDLDNLNTKRGIPRYVIANSAR
jgi:hypothetical protein